MKYLYLILFVAFCSCSKHSDNADQYGTIHGSITAYDKSGKENLQFDNINIKLINAQNQVSVGSVEFDGKFRFEKVIKGDVFLIFNKPGYGYIDTIKFDHERPNDTLSPVALVEDLPFNLKYNSTGYSDGWLSYSLDYDYQTTTDPYMVTYFICFSKTPDVTITKADLIWPEGSYWNIKYITGYYGGRSTFSYKKFSDAGFKYGDKIYAVLVPVTEKYGFLYNASTNPVNHNINYQIVTRKAGNTSNVLSFILNQ